ncbi:hypothetical protein MY4824_008292 [Beauveria thailandica]
MKINHVLRALLCIQQVSGRVAASDDTSLANVEDELPGESCSLSAKRSNIAGRVTEADLDDDCDEMLNELSDSDKGIDEADLAKLKLGDYSDIVCDLTLLSVVARFGNYNPPVLGRRDGANKNDCEKAREIVLANGRPLAEVFWVRVDNIDDENPGDLYGSIIATDVQGKEVIYKKARGDSEEIRPREQVFLTGPHRAISAAGAFTIDVDLTDKDRDASPDDQVSFGRASWTPSDRHNVLYEARITGEYGSATVAYVAMDKAAQADIEVILINGDEENPADIFGTITASTRFGQRHLFNKASNVHIEIRPGQKLPLQRSTLAVPMDDKLVFDVNVWDHDADWSPNDQVAKGKVELVPQVGLSIKRVVTGEFGKIQIRVTWS